MEEPAAIDPIGNERNRDSLKMELEKESPRREVILSLSRQLFPARRDAILFGYQEPGVSKVFKDFPELKSKSYVVSTPPQSESLTHTFLLQLVSWNRNLTWC